MKLQKFCGCFASSNPKLVRTPTDPRIEATPAELQVIRDQLRPVEELLGKLFGPLVYGRNAKSMEIRAAAADVICEHFDGIINEWAESVGTIFLWTHVDPEKDAHKIEGLRNSLIRFASHLRDPDCLDTYVYLRRHCQQGMLADAKPSQFNAIHIALKQIIINHIATSLSGAMQPRVRDAVVAAIDERRLMVSQFYIESREHLLRASEEKYRNSIDHAPDPMYEIEPGTWKVLAANSAAQRVHLLTPGEEHMIMVGRPMTDFVPDEMREELRKVLQRVVEQGYEHHNDVPIGPFFWDVNFALIPYGDKQFIQMIMHDVTQRREMLDSLLKSERLAAAGTFAAGVAHEVNNPLASISSLVQSLLPGEDDAQRRTTLHTILAQITRISGTLKDLVNFARPATGHQKLIDINQLVSDTLRVINYDKRFRGMGLDPVLAPDLRPAFADENEIQQVLLNLLYNAADATQGEGSMIRVITANKAGRQGGDHPLIVIRVVDNGIGIPREHLERVFDPFFTTKPAGSGVGLGLSLCQRIILSNKGTIRVDSELGKGTQVTILLPAHELATSDAHAAAR
jgi:PAS domain S-box-containing protein